MKFSISRYIINKMHYINKGWKAGKPGKPGKVKVKMLANRLGRGTAGRSLTTYTRIHNIKIYVHISLITKRKVCINS